VRVRAQEVAEVLAALHDVGVHVWVDGGWGVDALVGAESRPHKDLDLIVRLSDADAVGNVLQTRGFRLVAGTPPASALYRDDSGRGVDIRAVAFDGDGRGVYRAADEEIVFPAGSLDGSGTISDVAVQCLTPEAQMVAHTGYEPTDKDTHDLRMLHITFNLPLPPEYR
jgi:lincosamide nucleotidyltransferase A/C/D/E